MRPVLLEMDGFASFRQRTVIDFSDVDYFALVGATGAGKSTVIDAISFALYGSVARWDDERAVEPALAPTVNRGTVKLVFDAHRQRYIAMRELRRAASGSVSVKTARLEVLDDPGALGGPDDATTVLADGGKVKARVDELLGLDFNQFIKCVALPQGEFAEFLHSSGRDRDRILTKLLGIDIYLRLGQRANSRATHLNTTAEALRAAIDTTIDTSDETLELATARHSHLGDLSITAEAALATIAQLAQRRLAAEHEQETVAVAVAALSSVIPPEGLQELDAQHTDTQSALKAAATTTTDAEASDEAARSALRDHPPRSKFDQLAERHRERDALQLDQPGLTDQLAAADAAQATSERARDDADGAHQIASEAARGATASATEASKVLNVATEQLSLLLAAAPPADLATLVAEIDEADEAVVAATTAVDDARTAATEARTARDDAADPVLLERAGAALLALTQRTETARRAVASLGAAHATAAAATTTADTARTRLAEAETVAQANADQRVAADLRAHLHVGDACPVCEQTIASLPEPPDHAGADSATNALSETRTEAETTEGSRVHAITTLEIQAREATTALSSVSSSNETARAALSATSLNLSLPSTPADVYSDITTETTTEAVSTRTANADDSLKAVLQSLVAPTEALAEASTHRTLLDSALTASEQTLAEAERSLSSATAHVKTLGARQQEARVQLRATRDPLVILQAPPLDEADIPGAWATLATWAASTAKEHRKLVKMLEKSSTAASDAAGTAQEQAIATEAARLAAQNQHDAAVTARAATSARLNAATQRLAELDAFLDDEASLAEVNAALDKLDGLEQALALTSAQVTDARALRDHAQAAVAASAEAVNEARTNLSEVRDPLVVLGAPTIPDNLGLAEAWTVLTRWTAAELDARRTALDVATTDVESLRTTHATATATLRDQLAAADVEHPIGAADRPLTVWAPAALAAATAAALAKVETIVEARTRTAGLEQRAAAATEQSRVARTLGGLLSIDRFPRWLTRSALEVLVTAASATLMELSTGQFELTLNAAGAFTIIDHFDADAERIVKTLSGGETFQASLALALALSTHLGTLAASDADQLEAIFIDEGFGTLDEQTLEVVATTLETLAASSGRMVGVITHVPALAARVPVRFAVSRDRRGSSIEKVYV
jgi:DNA repair protein SbcC/Rad50